MVSAISRERALAHDSRVALLGVLQDSAEALDATQLAARVGLHVNTVRSHLRLLERAGLVVRSTEPRSEPGRPRVLYAAAAPDSDEGERYGLMAKMLASYIAANVADPASAAEETGRQWGRHLGPPSAPFTRTSEEQARRVILQLMDELGFAPRYGEDPSELELRHCPFRDVAEAHPEVACSLHLGLLRGALEDLGTDLAVIDLIPFVDPDRCVAHVGTREAS